MELTRADAMTAIGTEYLARVTETPAGHIGCGAPYQATLYRRTGRIVSGAEELEYVRSAYGLCPDQALRELGATAEVEIVG